jgi:hypothetical protein
MVYLVDTNILLRIAPRGPLLHSVVRAAVRKLRAGSHVLRAASQNFVEFWNVSTRPLAQNGYGLAPPAADRRLRRMERLFPLLPDSPVVYPEWRRLVVAYGVSGAKVHDARLLPPARLMPFTLVRRRHTSRLPE